MAPVFILITIAVIMALSSTYANDNNPLQDFCVAVPDASAAVFVNGKICKNPKLVTTDDFVATGFEVPANTTNRLGFGAATADVNKIPGLNTLGLTLMRFDIESNGVVPPHIHPRATEMFVIVEGTFYAGFVTSNPSDGTKNKLFARDLNPGDVFVVPPGLVHFVRNVGNTKGLAYVAFNSQNPGFIAVTTSVFGTNPLISTEVLTKSFQLDKKTIDYLQSKFGGY
ncbi:OLC1v1016649C1 [Oldenlandia corymbosa var. corymbosa]|uniref:Germin-like protein n=1 Tax=Oldenlandia corymbosa var. corymbosa TaxID=529605 RepID=A0AAV1E7N8_OLDCO|nr:OLC1v1016649C1 [Oldenlandia corymbosa var. corymbosa]